MARFFLTKSTVVPGSLVDVAGSPVLSRYDALAQSLEGVADPASIGALAEPLLSHGNDVAPATVVWYSSYPGEARRLSDLDADRREAVLSTLRQRLVDIAKGLSDPTFGPLVGAALNITDPDDVYVVDGQPVLVGWGMVPPEANTSPTARNRHFAQSMARYLPLAEAPPTTPDEWHSRRGAPERPVPPSTDPAPAVATPANAGGIPPGEVAVRTSRGGGWRWLPLLLLLLLATGALVWLLWPGTRIMPPIPPANLIADEEALRIAREANRALEQRAGELEEAIAGARCTAEGNLVLPDGRTPEGVLALLPEEDSDGEPAVREGRPDALLPPDPSRVEVPAEARAGEPEMEDPATLLDLIDRRTALVLVSGIESGTGTGFFVGPDLFVTNDHVIASAGPQGSIYVVNAHLGMAREAVLLDRLGPLEEAGGDFALLRVQEANAPFFEIRDSTRTMRLQNVIAAGYPGVILETDANFARLAEGDPEAIPLLAVTDGIVNVEQDLGPSTTVIIHTAEISGGNSGGPLVDSCGRVVGVNTFGRADDRTTRFLNFALSSTDLLRFLDGTVADPVRSSEPCVPRVRPPQPPPPLDPGGGVEPTPEPEEEGQVAPQTE